MSKFGAKFERSWQLLVGSFEIIGRNRKLLLFPLVAFAFTLVIVLFFVAPVVLIPTGFALTDGAHWNAVMERVGVPNPNGHGSQRMLFRDGTYLYLAVIYLVSMVSATFFNVAFYSQIMKALSGEEVSIRGGIGFAFGRIRSILLWSLFAGVIGLIIKSLEERFGLVGRLVLRFIGMVWSVASVFAIPVMVRNGNANPVELLRTSASTLKKTWGESLVGYIGITFGAWIILFASVVMLILGFVLGVYANQPLLIALLGLAWLVMIIGSSYILSVANHVFRCALYMYAADGVVPAPYTAELMEGAWKRKKVKA